jgi:hypothetical protein
MLDQRDLRSTLRCCFLGGISQALSVPAFGQFIGVKDFPNRREGANIRPNALEDFVLVATHKNFKTIPLVNCRATT